MKSSDNYLNLVRIYLRTARKPKNLNSYLYKRYKYIQQFFSRTIISDFDLLSILFTS
jgi:hypothetical protein